MKLPIALSNKHIHLSQADLEALFGEGINSQKRFISTRTIRLRRNGRSSRT